MFERYSASARHLIWMAHWSANRRGGSYIEPEDLLHAVIRLDRGEFAAIGSEAFPRFVAPDEESVGNLLPFFSGDVAADLLRELHEDPEPVSRETPGDKLEPAPHVDMVVSRSLQEVLTLVGQAHQQDTKTIEPLDLLAGIVENRDTRLAQLLQKHGITPEKVAKALGSGS